MSDDRNESGPSRPRRKAVELSAFLDRLRQAIEARGMSQAELARRLGIGPATVSEWSTRGRIPSGDVLLRLPDLLGVSGHWLLTGKGPREIPHEPVDLYQHGARDALGAMQQCLQQLQARFGGPPEARGAEHPHPA